METNSLFVPEETGGISLEEVFEAYFACRRKKRGTHNALAFEADYERKCIRLWREINAGTYKPSRSVAFIVFKPVQREVFAADFRDRVVHHLIARKIEPLLEAEFIDDSYSTRKEKGTLYGIRRVEGFVRECSENYTKDCYVMKLDIRSFFMDIHKKLLYERLEKFLRETYRENDLEMLLYLLRETIFNRPEKNCIRRCPASHWKGLPRDKSLFHSDGKHFATYNIRKKLLLEGGIAPQWWKVMYVSGHLEKIVLKKQYTTRARLHREMHREIVSYQLIRKEAV